MVKNDKTGKTLVKKDKTSKTLVKTENSKRSNGIGLGYNGKFLCLVISLVKWGYSNENKIMCRRGGKGWVYKLGRQEIGSDTGVRVSVQYGGNIWKAISCCNEARVETTKLRLNWKLEVMCSPSPNDLIGPLFL